MSDSSHSAPSQSAQKSYSIEQQIIILSQSSPQQAQMVPQNLQEQGVNEQVVQLVNPRYLNDDDQEERRKKEKIQNARKMLQNIEQEAKQQAKYKQQLEAKNISKGEMRKIEQQLKKKYKAYQHLSTNSLQLVDNTMMSFDRICRMEDTHKDLKIFRKTRYEIRKDLTQALLFTIHELKQKVKTQEYSDRESQLVEEQTNYLNQCYSIASGLQLIFFKVLVKQFGQLKDYQKQISVILRQFKDKNNVELRRNILNQTVDLFDLASKKEQDLKCQKTKEQELAELQQMIRESQKNPNNQRQYEEEADLQKINSMNQLRSQNQMIAETPVHQEETFIRDNMDLIVRCQQKFQKCDTMIQNYQIERNHRLQELIDENQHNAFFEKICSRYRFV